MTGEGSWRSLVDLLTERAAEDPQRPLYAWLAESGEEAESLTRGELDQRARGVAAAVADVGVGERALLLFPPGLDFIVAFFGCLFAGVVAVPAYPPRGRRSLPRLSAITEDSEPRVILTTAALLPRVRSWVAESASLAGVAVLAVDRLPASPAGDGRRPDVGPDTLAFLQYTSGSTAAPKGVRVSHGNLLHNEEMIRRAFGQSEESVIVSWLPLYHDMGLIGGVLQPLYAGARCLLTSPAAFLKRPALWLQTISRYAATTSGGPSFGYELCARKVTPAERQGLDLASWSVAFNGSEPVRAATLDRFTEVFAPCGFRRSAFYPCYGLAEATLFVSGGEVAAEPVVRSFSAAGLEEHRALPARQDGEPAEGRSLTACGRAWMGQRVEIVDAESRRRLPAGQVGEIWVAGASVADGYWRRPELTERDFRARLADDGEGGEEGAPSRDDVFLRTGDLGFLAAGARDGAAPELFVTGRLKDLIILRGRNLYPQDVERAAEAAHGALRAGCSAAFSVEAEGEERLVVVAEVERRFPAGDESAAQEVAEAVRGAVFEELEAPLYDLVLLRLGALPKTSSGKVRRRTCRQRYLAGELRGRLDAAADAAPEDEGTAAKDAEASGEASSSSAAGPSASPSGGGAEPSAADLREMATAERRSALGDLLARWAAQVLPVPGGRASGALPRDRPLTALGLDSLAAAELQAICEERLGVTVEYADLLEGASLDEVAGTVAASLATEAGTDAGQVAGTQPGLHGQVAGTPLRGGSGLPLSSGQQALWFLHRLAPESAAYHIVAAARVRGPLDAEALRRTLTALADRHPQLRATFGSEDGEPRQHVGDAGRVEWIYEDAAPGDDDELLRRLRRVADRPFDLTAGPPLRAAVLRRAADDHFLVLAFHHLVADFWSLAVLFRELDALYRPGGDAPSRAELAPPTAGYADFVDHERRLLAGSGGEELVDWWRRELDDGAVPDLDLPTDRPRPPVQTDRGDVVHRLLGGELTASVDALAAGHAVTPFAVLLAAFQALLARYSGQTDFLLGTPVAGRRRRALADVVGYFVNPVVLRTRAAGDPSFADLVSRAAGTAVRAFDHQALPFPRLTEVLRPVRDPSRSPLFQVFFSFQTPPRGAEALAPFALGTPTAIVPADHPAGGPTVRLGSAASEPLTLEPVALPRPPAQFDLNLMLARGVAPQAGSGGALSAAAVFNRDLFDAATLERLLGHLEVLLSAAVADPGQPLSRLPLLAAAERRQLLADWNDSAAEVPEPALVHALFELQAAVSPQRTALVFASGGQREEISYGELNRRSDRLAHHLTALGVGPEVPVGVLLQRSADMVTALLAVLKAGGAYLPLDPAYPAERVAFTLHDSAAPVVLTEGGLDELLTGYAGRRVHLDADLGEPPPVQLAAVEPSNAAYLIYTSGSTGRPKGVQVPHRPMVNFLASMLRRPGLTADDVLVSVTTLSFDIAGLELFGPLAAGARVVVADRETAADGAALLRLLTDSGATVMQATPTTWRLLLEAGWDGTPAIRALCGGEALPRELADAVARRATGLWNLYGPTETTVWSAVEPVAVGGGDGEATAVVSIGRPLANTWIDLLDGSLELVPVAVPGELYIGGAGLARGYYRRPARTAGSFVPDPRAGEAGRPAGARLYRTGDLARRRPDGRLDYLGRLDHQVKVRGVRIELGEVEAVLERHPALVQAVAATREAGPGDVRLAAWVVPAQPTGGDAGTGARDLSVGGARDLAPPDAVPTVAELRSFVAERLPESYVPSLFVFVDALPLTPNGKVDRKALPDPDGLRPRLGGEAVAPRSELERRVAAAWCEVLGVERVGVDDNFFDLGGHSLLLSRVQARLAAAGHELPMVELFRHPTVASLATRLESGAAVAGQGAATGGLERARQRRRRAAGEGDGRIAVVGYAGRFPKAGSVAELWRRLDGGEECITFFGDDELRQAGVEDALLADPAYVAAAAVLDDAARFDASFFGYTPRQAELMDPQHRVFLECAWQALEDAGCEPARFAGRVGVFAGAGLNTYLLQSGLAPGASMAGGYQAFLGNDKDFIPTRVSYELDLKGPSVNVQTACSSSLVAVHLACRSLLAGECDLALAGGVTIRVPLRQGYLYEEGGIPSPDGHCRAFAADAAGTVLGSGCGIVVLRRLDDAVAAGDAVRAVVLGSAVNNDGAGKVGYTAPSVDGQAEVIAEALAVAGVDAESVGYVEAHGTGTSLGDPIEVAALTEAFRGAGARRDGYCALGSVKSNVGHLDTAAGVTGLIKAVLALEHRRLPPTLHAARPNPKLELTTSPFRLVTEATPWETDGGPRRAGVSSFGIGGTNVHAVLEEAPSPAATDAGRRWQALPLSAKTESALEAATTRLAAALAGEASAADLADVAWTLHSGRRAFAHRRLLVARDVADAVEALSEPGAPRLRSAVAGGGRRQVAFLLPGQGSQHPGAGRGLYAGEPTFRRELDAVCERFAAHLPDGTDLRALLVETAPDDAAAAARLTRTEIAQPALFAVEHALARTWASWGVEPAALLGHSLGEYVAATLAGVFSLDDAVALVAERGRLMGELPPGDMLAVDLAADDLAPWLPPELSLAVVNAPGTAVASGEAAAVAELARRLDEAGVRHRLLHTSHAFHSAMMDPVLDRFAAAVAAVERRPPRIPFVSNVTGTWIGDDEAVDPAYWSRHLRSTVRFGDGLATLLADPDRVLLEVGPGRVLSQLAGRAAAGRGAVPSLPHPRDPQPEEASLAEAVGRLWLAGVEVDWERYGEGRRRRRVSLPPYPFEGREHFLSAPSRGASQAVEEGAGERRRDDPADWFYAPAWGQLLPAPAAPLDGGPWLLLAGAGAQDDPAAEELATALADALRSGAGDGEVALATARPGEPYERARRGVYRFDAAQREGWSALLAALAEDGLVPRRVVHALDLGRGAYAAAEAVAPVAALVHLAAALEGAGALAGGGVELVVLAAGALRVAGEAVPRPRHALSLGALRALPQEHPGLAARFVDLDGSPTEDRVADLLAELADRAAPEVVAWRGGVRWAQRFAALRLPPAPAAPVVRAGRSYLVTGGLGGVGFALAEELARAGAQVVVTGRRELAAESGGDGTGEAARDERGSRLHALRAAAEAAGGEVLYLAADVTDRGAMAAALAAAEARLGVLAGVVHAAGVAGGGLAAGRDGAEMAAVLAPKVTGSVVLGELLADRLGRDGDAGGLDFLLFVSSIQAVAGGFGQVDYCAANAFLDAYATCLAPRRGARVAAVDWDRWRGVGMAADATGGLLASLALGGGGGHPLLGRRLSAAAGRQVWAGELSPRRHWVLAEHRVLGTPTVPGTTYLEMARAAFAGRLGGTERDGADGGPVEISEVAFLAPLAMADGGSRRVLTVLEEETAPGATQVDKAHEQGVSPDAAPGASQVDGDGERSASSGAGHLSGAARRFGFKVMSQGPDDAWVEHARGRLAAATAEPRRHDVDALLAACGERRITAADALRPLGGTATAADAEPFLVTGPRWHALQRLDVGDGRAMARFELDERFTADLVDHPLHPALLDLAAGAVRFLAAGDYLPLSYERLTVHGPLPARGWSHLELGAGVSAAGESAAETLTCDVSVMDDDGVERLRVEGFSMRRVAAEAAARLLASAGGKAAAESAADPGTASGTDAAATPGLSAAEGVETFRRLLAGPRLPQVVVCPHPLDAYRRRVRAFDRDRVAQELAALAAGAPAAPRPATGGAAYQAPEGDLERRIAAVWQRVLGIEQVGVNDNFFELGGTSLAGIQLVSELKRELGVEIPTVSIFEAPTVAALARLLGSGDGAADTAERAGDRAARKQAALAARRRERQAARAGRGGGR